MSNKCKNFEKLLNLDGPECCHTSKNGYRCTLEPGHIGYHHGHSAFACWEIWDEAGNKQSRRKSGTPTGSPYIHGTPCSTGK